MKVILWNAAKNEKLKRERHVSFEEVVARIQSDGLLDTLDHPAPARYPGQHILVVEILGYVYLVPYTEAEDHLFLKTIIPNRQATKRYLKKGTNHED